MKPVQSKLKQSVNLLKKSLDEIKSGGDGVASVIIACGYICDAIKDIESRVEAMELKAEREESYRAEQLELG